MRILSCEEVEKLAGLHNHFDRVHTHRSLLTELTVRVLAQAKRPHLASFTGVPECRDKARSRSPTNFLGMDPPARGR